MVFRNRCADGGQILPNKLPPLSGLPPIIDERSRVLVLGSFPSVQSLEKRQYYGNRLNQFWGIMETLFGIDRDWAYARRTVALLDGGVAVWDVIAACRREGSGDDAIKDAEANPIMDMLRSHPRIQYVAFNGSTAWATARRLLPGVFQMPGAHCERMPSTSPKHARRSLEEKAASWASIRKWLRMCDNEPQVNGDGN